MNKFGFISMIIISLISCDVRRSDKIVDDSVAQIEKAQQDTTSVQLIDSVYDFGKVSEGEKVSFSFRFRNSGNKPLVISSATASCGCTVPEKPEKPVMPGETGYIKVVFNSQGKPGHNEKNINVVANTNPSFPTLLLKGDVTKAN